MSPFKKIDWKHMFSWKRLYDYFFPRAVLGLFGFRHPGFTASHKFIPFFQYKIGSYETNYCLYFKSEPSFLRYTIEFFEKMKEYTGHALVGYLEFHYNAYPDKKEFLRFLHYEVAPSPHKKAPFDFRRRRETILTWIAEQEKILASTPGQDTLAVSPTPIMGTLADNPTVGTLSDAPAGQPAVATQPGPDDPATPSYNGALIHEQIASLLEHPTVLAAIQHVLENTIPPMIRAFHGKIKLTHDQHTEKLIQLLIILQNLRAPGKKPEMLFENFHNTDMTAVLRQLAIFGDKKANTIQVKIAEVNGALNNSDPKIEKLVKALTDFFYGPSGSHP